VDDLTVMTIKNIKRDFDNIMHDCLRKIVQKREGIIDEYVIKLRKIMKTFD